MSVSLNSEYRNENKNQLIKPRETGSLFINNSHCHSTLGLSLPSSSHYSYWPQAWACSCSYICSINSLHIVARMVIQGFLSVLGFFLHDTDQVVMFLHANFTYLGPVFGIWANQHRVGSTGISKFSHLLHREIISKQHSRNGPWPTVAPKPCPGPVWKSTYWPGPNLFWGQFICTDDRMSWLEPLLGII